MWHSCNTNGLFVVPADFTDSLIRTTMMMMSHKIERRQNRKKTHGIWHLWIWIWVTLLIWFRKSHWNFPLFLLDTSNKFKGIRLNSEIHVDKRIHCAQENKRSVRFWFYAYAEVWIVVKMFFICWSFAMKRHGSPFTIALHWRLFPFYLAKFLEYLQLCVSPPPVTCTRLQWILASF